ncbi:hypothetical protein Vadar_016013 [Vaccinium darrowii]|uniref:Uncharacterized protein n=1 Tax=Vaccinium darrowii TaxID=229202 RepID=A0ACB7XQZ7_9ERIC|nr:hypothetical protein Vadar_016013 [Vaccinium darrowii]
MTSSGNEGEEDGEDEEGEIKRPCFLDHRINDLPEPNNVLNKPLRFFCDYQSRHLMVQFRSREEDFAKFVKSQDKEIKELKYEREEREKLQAYFLALEDIMDNSHTRRGQPCWLRVPKVAEQANFLWNNEHSASLIAQNQQVIWLLIFEALERNMQSHWNQAVHCLTSNVQRMSLEMDTELFEEWDPQYAEREAGFCDLEEERELNRKRLMRGPDERCGHSEKKRDTANQVWGSKPGGQDNIPWSSEGEYQSLPNKDSNPYYQEQRVQPCHLSSSIYYGGQDGYSHPRNTQASGYSTFNKEGGEDDPRSASRGNWWQGSRTNDFLVDEHIVSLIAQNRQVIWLLIFEALERNIQSHWN